MTISEVSNGAITGTGYLRLTNNLIGGILVNADGTNAASITLRDGSNTGPVLFSYSSKQPLFIQNPIRCNSNQIYYSISGTGTSVEIFEGSV